VSLGRIICAAARTLLRPLVEDSRKPEPVTASYDINYSTTMRTYLGEFEQLLLFALVQLDGDAYGAGIRRLIEARTGRTVSPGAIYTALDRLESRRLVSSALGEPTARRGGKRRRYYRIEPAGVELLRRSHDALARMAQGLDPGLESL
jgi:PadR family transcriptional regulator PadR